MLPVGQTYIYKKKIVWLPRRFFVTLLTIINYVIYFYQNFIKILTQDQEISLFKAISNAIIIYSFPVYFLKNTINLKNFFEFIKLIYKFSKIN